MEVLRIGASDSQIGITAIQQLKSGGTGSMPPEGVAAFVADSNNILIVASDGDAPVGYLVAYLLDRVDRPRPMILLYEIEVAHSYRRRGLATQMIAALKRLCRDKGVMKMWVLTHRSNIAAMRLYCSAGATASRSDDDVVFTFTPANW